MGGVNERSFRKVIIGHVVSNKMDKTIVIAVKRRTQHPRYKKFISKTFKLVAHDESNNCSVGDLVKVMETRPLSKTKRWRLIEVVESSKRIGV